MIALHRWVRDPYHLRDIMRNVISLFVLIALSSTVYGTLPENADRGSVGSQAVHFTLRDYRGSEHELATHLANSRYAVIAFLGTECPLAKLYGPRLADLEKRFADQGVVFLGVNANRHDSVTEIAAYARRSGVTFPILKDTGNKIADQLGADRTPEVFLIDRTRTVLYRGRIDDQYGVGQSRSEATHHYLRDALLDVLADRPVAQSRTEAVGCHIGRILTPDNSSPITYGQQISRLLQRHCVECHRAGEIAPFPLTTYDEVVGWAETIREVVEDQRMPPWHANPKHGEFANTRLMTAEEKQQIEQWVRAGAPEGDPKAVPEPLVYRTGWQLPSTPDRVIAMHTEPFEVAAEGTVEYQYFVVDPGFQEDTWIQAAEVIPGNRQVVHHAIVFVRPPKLDPSQGMGWLTAYVPGQAITNLPHGLAKLVPAGSKLVFQMHYTPVGRVQTDLTRVGLVLADPESVKEQVITMLAINRNFEIPPGASDHPVEARAQDFPTGSRLLAISPHMHLRGKSFQFHAVKDGTSTTLLDVPQYDFNWQHVYILKTPLPLDNGLAIHCTGHFDNSAENLVNPDPSSIVRWGDQTWEEMMLGFMEIAVPRNQLKPGQIFTQRPLSQEQQARASRTADQLISRFDRNKDGLVGRDEVPDAFAVFAFRRFDLNGDRSISRDEALRVSEASLRREQLRRRAP